MLPDTARGVALASLLLWTVGAKSDEPVPWPRGAAPSPAEIDAKVTDALELFDRERDEEFLEALEEGEDSEHIFVLQEWIDENRYGTREPGKLFQFGDSAFEHEFRMRDGYGDRRELLRMRRVHEGSFGGRDTFSCAGCHSVGGFNGAGAATQTSFYFGDGARLSSAVMRNPPAVLGLGLVQILGVEMSRELARSRDEAVAAAVRTGKTIPVRLTTKGVSFGRLVVLPDGTVDASEVEGVDRDLVVKPFGWKGHTARLRRFAERAAQIHFGIQSHVLATEHQQDPDPARLGFGTSWWDPDGDGVQRELEEGTLTALGVYLALLEIPVILPPRDPALQQRWARGSELFDRIGCVDCHRRSLPLGDARWIEEPDTTGAEGVPLDLRKDGDEPRAEPSGTIALFSDLKRHDMGELLADPSDDPDGIGRSVFLTRPLWGLAETAPYLHDGRAATIPEAILQHGGEAASQRASFEALTDEQRRDLHVFLLSLTREPKLRVAR
jgi:hypothetical protein